MTILSLVLLAACGGSDPAPAPSPSPAPAAAPAPAPAPAPDPAKDFATMDEAAKQAFLMESGKEVYNNGALPCKTCHMEDGKGQTGVFPPLVGQKDHMGDCVHQAGIVIYGLSGEMVVDGVTYNGVMTPQGAMLNDLEIAAVTSYVRNSWGNDYGYCGPEHAAQAREKNPLTP